MPEICFHQAVLPDLDASSSTLSRATSSSSAWTLFSRSADAMGVHLEGALIDQGYSPDEESAGQSDVSNARADDRSA
jgi:hypothetical protein